MHKSSLNPLPRAENGHFSHFLRTDSQFFVRQIFAKSFRIHCGSKMCSNRSELSIAPTKKWFRTYICSIEICVSRGLLRERLKKNILKCQEKVFLSILRKTHFSESTNQYGMLEKLFLVGLKYVYTSWMGCWKKLFLIG